MGGKTFAGAVRAARTSRKWSLEKLGREVGKRLGREAGVTGRHILRIEQGEQLGSTELVVQLALTLDIDLNLLKPPDSLDDADTEPLTAPTAA